MGREWWVRAIVVVLVATLCSLARPSVAITGGSEVDQATFESDWPFVVFLDLDGPGRCTGSLVSLDAVLTAAHCLEDEDIESIVVRTGATDVTAGAELSVADAFPHPDYDPESAEHDLALLRLDAPAPPPAAPIRVITASEAAGLASPFAGEMAGYGFTDGFVFPAKLHEGDAQIVSGSSDYSAGSPPSTCGGDSGGPLVATLGAERVLTGIASRGDNDCELFSVFTKAGPHQAFYADEIGTPVAVMSVSPPSPSVGGSVAFDLSGSDDDGTIESYTLDPGDNRAPTSSPDPDFTHAYTAPGTYPASGCVTDDDARTRCVFVDVVVTGPGSGPDIVVSADPMSGDAPVVVSFDLSGTEDADGDVLSYSLDPGDGDASVTQPGTDFQHTYTAAGSYVARVSVTDDDGYETVASVPIEVDVGPDVSISDAAVKEGNRGTRVMTFTVVRAGSTDGSTKVDIDVVPGSAKEGKDYVAAPTQTLTFAAGEVTRPFTVLIRGDRKRERNETLFAELSNVFGGTIDDGSGRGKIRDND